MEFGSPPHIRSIKIDNRQREHFLSAWLARATSNQAERVPQDIHTIVDGRIIPTDWWASTTGRIIAFESLYRSERIPISPLPPWPPGRGVRINCSRRLNRFGAGHLGERQATKRQTGEGPCQTCARCSARSEPRGISARARRYWAQRLFHNRRTRRYRWIPSCTHVERARFLPPGGRARLGEETHL
jgi:hypothetical protein